MKRINKNLALTPGQILAIGFAVIILTGALLLTLPACSRGGRGLPFLSALFTSTSATCVTGLAVCDTYTQFSFPGQLVIMCLIEIGGLGFIALAMTFSFLVGKRISFFQREILMASAGTQHVGGVVRLVKRTLIGSLVIQSLGATVMACRLVPMMGIEKGIWYGIFHAVSAFCNAGFDLMGTLSPSSSLTLFADDPVMEITVMLLIIIGGIGFVVWNDIAEHRTRFREYTLHSKIMIRFTLALVIGGAAVFFLLERGHAFSGMGTGETVLNSFFASVTPRTAGFNSVDYNSMTEAGRVFTMLLMFIGAGSGSTGGGVKVTTFATIILSLRASAKNYNSVSFAKRRLPDSAQKKAMSSMSAYVLLVIASVFVLLISDPNVTFESGLFESLSAIGTVGLSMGITSSLSAISKLALIILMYCGRLGSISVAVVLMRRKNIAKISYPEEDVTLG